MSGVWPTFSSTTPHFFKIILENTSRDIKLEKESMKVVARVDKRGRPASPMVSPKKMKAGTIELLTSPVEHDIPIKKLKILIKFTAKALGLKEAPGGLLVSKLTPLQASGSGSKKKRGRPLGARNKNPPKTSRVSAEDVLKVLYSGKPPSPNPKGKENV